MKKYLVDVYLPTIGTHYDVYLPANKTMQETTRLIVQLVERLSGGSYKGGLSPVLMAAESGDSFPRNVTVHDAGIRNAAKLILV
ncbi:MAG: hypothetical protein R3Y62_01515 [Eubacteriales bacterium]